jgi:cellulose synthase/poly-beta-1,6-N-acetylglucosamine synthase-like glycosyltransferase
MEIVVETVQWSLLLYFVMLNAGYIALNLLAFRELSRCMQTRALETLPQVYSGLEIPITLIVPAYNEATTIVTSIQSLLQVNYPEFEILVVNDGSNDGTLDVMRRAFSLEVVPEAFRVRVACQPVRAVYRSRTHPNLRVIDKENGGGKADALNAGINGARYPLFCSLDADSVLQRDSLHRVVLPFLEDSRTVAAGGIVRLLNGCDVSGGFLVRAGLPRNPLAIIQVVEYLRAFLFGRLGWSPLNAVLCISGAFGLFHKETVITAGGFRTDTVGEDMELVMRLHRLLRHQGKPYRIVFVPDPVCWTEAPESRRVLRSQRIRWQRGLAESLSLNRQLLFSRKGGALGWIAFPFAVLFEFASPIVELAGYLFFAVGLASGVVSLESTLVFLGLAIGVGMLLSITGLLLEEMAFHVYPRVTDILILLLAVLLENFGYRQMNGVWRLIGLWQWATGRKAVWGEMTRTATWQRDPVGLRH